MSIKKIHTHNRYVVRKEKDLTEFGRDLVEP
jgi:hypothetical protein